MTGGMARLNINDALLFCIASKSWTNVRKDCQVNVKQKVNLHQISQLPKQRQRKYDEAYLTLSFTSITVSNDERPHCVVCFKKFFHSHPYWSLFYCLNCCCNGTIQSLSLASDSMKPNKLRRHSETSHPEHKAI